VTIGQVAKRSGLAPSALRYYEAEGLLPTAERLNGRRQYDESVFTRLGAIQVAQRAGFTISEIRMLMSGFSDETTPSERWQELARRKLPEVDALLARATEMKRILEEGLACRCVRLDECALTLTGGVPDAPAHAAVAG
jgi:MerR family redox-sensitive transcriptional activator SoxR